MTDAEAHAWGVIECNPTAEEYRAAWDVIDAIRASEATS